MNRSFLIAGTSIALAACISLCACHDTNKFERNSDHTVSSVSNYSSLGVPDVPSKSTIENKLQSSEGIKIAKVGGQWFWRNSYSTTTSGGSGQDTITVNVPLGESNDKFVTIRFDCDDLATLLITDVTRDSEAYMTFGDGVNYAYILHIPADSEPANDSLE